jgi:multidrug efflux pump
VSQLPEVDFPTIQVKASLPGASPEVVATSMATPLERYIGRIAGITEMTSSSTLGSTSITIQFDLDRNIDGAAREVQAALDAAMTYLPANMPVRPTYRKVNPADAPILILSLTSDIYTRGQIFDAASSVLQQKISQIDGVGQVNLGGSALPGIRVELNPTQLNNYGIGLDAVQSMLSATNILSPKGQMEFQGRTFDIVTNDQMFTAAEYQHLILRTNNKNLGSTEQILSGNSILLSQVADIQDSVENRFNAGSADGKPAVLVVVFKEPGANVIDTVDRIKESMPNLKASIPAGIDMQVVIDRTVTIRASLKDIEQVLVLSTLLVIGVVLVFLRNLRAALIPSIAIPLSLLGTCAGMYFFHFSLDNISFMALTVATGFVVDDAIVVLENISRHLENGKNVLQASLVGASEVSFTVLSMSVSLIAVFLPILLMGGIIHCYFGVLGSFVNAHADDVFEIAQAYFRTFSKT